MLARLVEEERVGRERVYPLRPLSLQPVVGWLEGYRSLRQSSLERLKKHVEENP